MKKTEFLFNVSSDYNVEFEYDFEYEDLANFYSVLVWMYIISGFDSWFDSKSEKQKKYLEQEIRDKYKKDIERFKS